MKTECNSARVHLASVLPADRPILFVRLSLVFLIGGALASSRSSAAEDVLADSQLQEITVTAQRREESLSKTPVAVTVVSADELAKNQVLTEQDLRFAAPGLTVRTTINSNQLGFAIRGQSQDAYSNSRPGVLPYFNEVQISTSGQGSGSTALYDLQSVQVLKGPQGTLFGRSATGGAVLYTTAKPTTELDGYVSVLGGNYDAKKLEGAVGGPLIANRLEGRIAGYFQKRDGFQDNLYDGSKAGDTERTGGRISLTAHLSDSIHNELVYDFLHSSGGNTIGAISGLTPFTGGVDPPYLPIQLLYSGTDTPVHTATGEAVLAGFVPPAFAPLVPAFYEGYFADPHHPATGLTAYLATQQARGPYTVDSDSPNRYSAKNHTVSNTTTFNLNESNRIKNIFGYVHQSSLNSTEADGTPYSVVSGTGYEIINRGLSDEIQLLGDTSKLSYVAGVYLSHEKEIQDLNTSFFDLIFGGQSQVNNFSVTHKTIAPYGQATYQLNDSGLSLTLGARFTNERVGFTQLPLDSGRLALGPTPPAGFSYDQSSTYNRVSWQIGLQDQVTPNVLLYAVSRRADKSGGYNGTVLPKVGLGSVGGNAFDAERVIDVELGAKWLGAFNDRPIRANLALFNLWDRNSQHRDFILAGASPSSFTVNVPKAKTYGAELDGQIKPVSYLTLGASYTYVHATFGSEPVVVVGIPQVFDQVPDTPKSTASAYADLNVAVASDYEINLRGDVYYQDKIFGDSRSLNNTGTVVPSFTVANFRIGFEPTAGHWSIQANLKNAFDRRYFVGALPTGVIYQINTAIPGEPRTYTFEARYKF